MIEQSRSPTKAILLVASLLSLMLAGCSSSSDEQSQEADPRDKLCKELSGFYPCSDGTFYAVSEKGQVFWLVNGKAVCVPCDDKIVLYDNVDPVSDPHGGIYFFGEKHFWYFKSGKALQVIETPAEKVSEEEHRTTRTALLWSAMKAYGTDRHATGRDEGYDSGYEAGYSEGYGDGRGE